MVASNKKKLYIRAPYIKNLSYMGVRIYKKKAMHMNNVYIGYLCILLTVIATTADTIYIKKRGKR